jgi:hypothetical protein
MQKSLLVAVLMTRVARETTGTEIQFPHWLIPLKEKEFA